MPESDVPIDDSFLESNERYLFVLTRALWEGMTESKGATDYDVRDALIALVSAQKAISTGIYYETRPTNPYAASIYEAVRSAVESVRQEEREDLGAISGLRDSTLLKLLIFLRRLEVHTNNGRKRSRAFIDMIRRLVNAQSSSGEEVGDPEEPLIIL